MIARHGWVFIDEFFLQHHLARYFSNRYRHPGPVYYYVIALMWLTLPWTLLIVDGLSKVRSWKWRGPEPLDKLRVFAAAWLLLPLAFFSFSGSKLAGYILPVLPAMALIGGVQLTRFNLRAPGKSLAMRATGALIILIGIAGSVFAFQVGYFSTRVALVVIAPLAIAGLIALVLTERRTAASLAVILGAVLSPVLVLNTNLVKLTTEQSVRDLIAAASTRGYANAPVYGLGEFERTAEFYASGRVAYGADGEPVIFENADQVMMEAYKRGPILVLVPGEYDQLIRLKTLGAEPIGDNGRFVLIAVKRPMPQHY